MSSGDQVQGKVPLLLDADRDGREVEGAFAAGNGLVVLVPPASKGKECECFHSKLDAK